MPSYWRTSACCVELLRAGGLLRHQRAVALEIEPRVLQQRTVARQLSLRLLELYLEGPRVDFGQQVAGLDHLPFAEVHPQQLAVDARAHGDRVQRRDRAQCVQHDRHVGAADGSDGDRDRALAARGAAPAGAAGTRSGTRAAPGAAPGPVADALPLAPAAAALGACAPAGCPSASAARRLAKSNAQYPPPAASAISTSQNQAPQHGSFGGREILVLGVVGRFVHGRINGTGSHGR